MRVIFKAVPQWNVYKYIYIYTVYIPKSVYTRFGVWDGLCFDLLKTTMHKISHVEPFYSYFTVSLFAAHHPDLVVAEKLVGGGRRWSVSLFSWAMLCFWSHEVDSVYKSMVVPCRITNKCARAHCGRFNCKYMWLFRMSDKCRLSFFQYSEVTLRVWWGPAEIWGFAHCLSNLRSDSSAQSLLIYFSTLETFDLAPQQ